MFLLLACTDSCCMALLSHRRAIRWSPRGRCVPGASFTRPMAARTIGASSSPAPSLRDKCLGLQDVQSRGVNPALIPSLCSCSSAIFSQQRSYLWAGPCGCASSGWDRAWG